MSLTRRILRLLAIVVLTPVLFLLGCQSRLIYYPRPYDEKDLTDLKRAGGQQLDYRTSLGRQVAFYLPPKSPASGVPHRVWLCFAGNGSLALDWLGFVEDWDRSCGYLLIDYPAYGACEGKPNPSSIRESSIAAAKRLAEELQTTAELLKPKISVLGHSIGCAAALMAADDLDVKRAVLIAPFTTMTEMGRKVLGWPLCHLNLHPFDNRRHLTSIVNKGARITIFHGADDSMIPVAMSRELTAQHPEAVSLSEIRGAGHNDIVSIAAQQIGRAMAGG